MSRIDNLIYTIRRAERDRLELYNALTLAVITAIGGGVLGFLIAINL